MKTPVMIALSLLSICSVAEARRESRSFSGNYEQVVCIGRGHLNARSADLKTVLFAIANHEQVKIFQGWGDVKRQRRVGGRLYTFVKVQVPSREARGLYAEGWVAEELIRPRSQCSGSDSDGPGEDFEQEEEQPRPRPVPQKPGRVKPPVKPVPPQKPTRPSEEQWENPGSNEQISGLNDPDCCEFPTKGEVTQDFDSGMRSFGWRRGGGKRKHAACDLYRFRNEPMSSVAPGTVLRGLYSFYQGTYALEVRHSGGFVVRYGEITGKSAPGVRSGSRVKMGQVLGYIGKVNSGCCEPMLHFELFSGAGRGSLSGGGIFQRRSDLLNPTSYLRKWEGKKFKSWK